MTTFLILLACLSAPQFRVREAAQVLLTPANRLTLPLLEWAERHHPHLEGRRRAGKLVDRWYDAQRAAYTAGRMPWIDPKVDGFNRLLMAAREKVGQCGSPDWSDYAEATRLLVQERIAARQPFLETLRQLWRLEWAWRWRYEAYPWCW